jgi:hypothetical protein
MKPYALINGTELYIISAENYDEARTKAINACDHSKEIIVREITKLEILTKINLDSIFN